MKVVIEYLVLHEAPSVGALVAFCHEVYALFRVVLHCNHTMGEVGYFVGFSEFYKGFISMAKKMSCLNNRPFFTSIVHYANRSIVSVEVFFYVDRGVSSCKLSREYFSLWVINTSLYGNTNTSTLPVCTNKTTRDKSLHNK